MRISVVIDSRSNITENNTYQQQIVDLEIDKQLCSACLLSYAKNEKNISELNSNFATIVKNSRHSIIKNIVPNSIVFQIKNEPENLLILAAINEKSYYQQPKENKKQGKTAIQDLETLDIIEGRVKAPYLNTNLSVKNYLQTSFCNHNNSEIYRELSNNIKLVVFSETV